MKALSLDHYTGTVNSPINLITFHSCVVIQLLVKEMKHSHRSLLTHSSHVTISKHNLTSNSKRAPHF